MRFHKPMKLFLNTDRQLRSGWWVLIFLLVLTSFLVPALFITQQNGADVSIGLQAIIIALASFICQLLYRKPLAELLGKINGRWFKELCLGALAGSALMLVPALILNIFGWVTWQVSPAGFSVVLSRIYLFLGVAVAEEMLFRGFIFQRLLSGIGQWPAQLIIAGFFLLTHTNNPGMASSIRILASVNIFLASILFGLAFIRTRQLAMPLGLHFMANLMQGGVLGFGVSGTDHSGLLIPTFVEVPEWLTGGQFGLEASIFGLFFVVLVLILLFKWKPQAG
jgi:membrane protease YdiL (CAAX protease family)